MSHLNRDRSRDRQGYRGRSQSPPDSNEKKKRTHHRNPHHSVQKPEPKRVKFNDTPDIKFFKKDDQPNCKGMTEAELEEYMKKIEAEKGANNYNQNWDKLKHMDAQNESSIIKEQKQKQRGLMENLQKVKEEIQFYSPPLLKTKNHVVRGQESKQKLELDSRLNDVLGCFYVHESQIPPQPSFQIQNKSTSHQPKLINFDKQRIDNKDLNITKKKQKDLKPIKGILKMTPEERARQRSESAPRKVDPGLIALLKQMQINKAAYPKERKEVLLQKYKNSGQLDYLLHNPQILDSLMNVQPERVVTNQSNIIPRPSPQPQTQTPTQLPQQLPQQIQQQIAQSTRYSISPQTDRQERPQQGHGQYGQYNPPPNYNNYGQYNNHYSNYQRPGFNPNITQTHTPHTSMPGMYNSSNSAPYQATQQPSNPYPSYGQQNNSNSQQMYTVNRNFRTVPCKYFHSPQGCVKAANCTFIHEQEYAGRPSPSMLRSNRGMVMNNYNPAQNDSNAPMGNFYSHYPNEGYQGQN